MEAGKLRHRIEVQTLTESRGDMGESVKSWSTTETRWAGIKPLTGRELEFAQQIHAETTHTVTMRHTTLTTDQRLKFGDRVFQILAVINPEERGLELSVICKEWHG